MDKKKISDRQCYDTGLAVILILLLISWFTEKDIYWKLSIPVLVCCMTVPKVFSLLARGWFAFSQVLGNLVSKLILTIIFFVVVTPVALLMKIVGKDAMQLKKWKAGHQSVFFDRSSKKIRPEDFERPF